MYDSAGREGRRCLLAILEHHTAARNVGRDDVGGTTNATAALQCHGRSVSEQEANMDRVTVG